MYYYNNKLKCNKSKIIKFKLHNVLLQATVNYRICDINNYLNYIMYYYNF